MPRDARSNQRFSLSRGVRLETFADASGLLVRERPEGSITLNATAALFCAYADGTHTVATVMEEVRSLSPETTVTEADAMAFLATLEEEGYLDWE